MSVKARWFFEEAIAEAEGERRPIEDVGKPIDLDGEPRLNQRLIGLVHAEQALYNRDVTCPIKERDDTSCNACPVRQEAGALSELCSVGVEQERVITELAALRYGRSK